MRVVFLSISIYKILKKSNNVDSEIAKLKKRTHPFRVRIFLIYWLLGSARSALLKEYNVNGNKMGVKITKGEKINPIIDVL